MQIIQGGWVAQCLNAVTLLGIPDVLESGPKHIKDIAEAAKVDEDSLHRVMRVLSASGIFIEDPDSAIFSPTPVSKALISGVRDNSQAMVKLLAHESHAKPLEPLILAESIRSGQDGFQLCFGQGSDFWKYSAEKPDLKELFWQAMESTSTLFHTSIINAHDFSQYKKLVDVGGGFGTLLRNILHKTPSLQGVLFELPHVIERASIREDKELEGRVEYAAGNFFESVYAGADCYISTTVLHDWNDQKAGQILDAIQKAAPQGSRLLLGETVVPNDTEIGRAHV